MLSLFVNGQPVKLLRGTTIAMEINNPIFDNEIIKGSYSLSFTIPLTPESGNRLVFGFPDVLDNIADLQRNFDSYLEADGQTIKGMLKLRKISNQRATANLQLGVSALSNLIKEKKITEFQYKGPRAMGTDILDLIRHMNATVTRPAAFDYVFAPFQNNGAYGEKEAEEGETISPFFVNYYGKNTKGKNSFLANYFDPYLVLYNEPTSIAPLPYLRYVVLSIFEELGIKVEDSFFDEELARLVIVSNTLLDEIVLRPRIDTFYEANVNIFRKNFQVSDMLPEITVIALLKKLAASFGLTIQVTLANTLVIEKLKDVATDTRYVDWTDKAEPGAEVDINDPEGFTLKYTSSSEDRESGDLIKEITPGQLKDPVADVTSLPAKGDNNEIRFVTGLNQFYFYQVDKGWQFYSENYPDLAIAGGGAELPQGHCVMMQKEVPYSAEEGLTSKRKLPVLNMEAYAPSSGTLRRSEELRLAFFRGLQPDSQDDLYPMLSDDNVNVKGDQVGNYSLRLDGQHGTYEMFLKDWLQFQVRKKVVTRKIRLNMIDLANINLNRKVNIAGIRYLVRKISIALPIRQAATVELWKC